MNLTEREHELDFEYELNEHDTEVVRNALKWAYELGKKDQAEKHTSTTKELEDIMNHGFHCLEDMCNEDGEDIAHGNVCDTCKGAFKRGFEMGQNLLREKHRKPLLDAMAKVMREISTRIPKADEKPVADALGELLEAISECVYGGTTK